jgi:hypothetical protein
MGKPAKPTIIGVRLGRWTSPGGITGRCCRSRADPRLGEATLCRNLPAQDSLLSSDHPSLEIATQYEQ